MSRMQRKANAIDDLLYSVGNHVTVREEQDQYPTLPQIVHHASLKYCNLLDAENQHHEGNWFDGLDQDVFNFKHRLHS